MVGFKLFVISNLLLYVAKLRLHLYPVTDRMWLTWPLMGALSAASFLIGSTANRIGTRAYEKKIELICQMLKMREFLAEGG